MFTLAIFLASIPATFALIGVLECAGDVIAKRR